MVVHVLFGLFFVVGAVSQEDCTDRSCEYGMDDNVCIDSFQNCSYLHEIGECDKVPGYMTKFCPLACSYCHLRNFRDRCSRTQLRTDNSAAVGPFLFQEIFSRIVSNNREMFGQVEVLSRNPWIITIDNFLFNQEATALIENAEDWSRSTVMKDDKEEGLTSPGRTSINGWCWAECEKHPYVKNIVKKIARTSSVHRNNFEPIQVLHYGPGEKYNLHHDTDVTEDELACGMRVFTFLLYLNDVEEGGETHFPAVGVTVKPKKGRAVFWPGVLDDDPFSVDKRTAHEAMPVIRGEKYAANVWIRMYDYLEPMRWGCIREERNEFSSRDNVSVDKQEDVVKYYGSEL